MFSPSFTCTMIILYLIILFLYAEYMFSAAKLIILFYMAKLPSDFSALFMLFSSFCGGISNSLRWFTTRSAEITARVRNSATGMASQIPSGPSSRGSSTNAGTGNIIPRRRVYVVARHACSMLWKKPMKARLRPKAGAQKPNVGTPAAARL